MQASFTVRAAAQSFDLFGPVRQRDLTPFELLRLAMPAGAGPPAPRVARPAWSLEVSVDHGSIWAMSEKVRDYLVARGGGRRPISAADIRAILAIPGDVFFLDGEIGLVDTTLSCRPDERWLLYATLPAYYYTGGFLDATIEGYHHTLGLNGFQRGLVSRDRFTMVYRIGREQVVESGAPSGGIGDPVLGARWRLASGAGSSSLPAGEGGAGRGWELWLEGAGKVSVHPPGPLSTGRSDLGAQLSLSRTLTRSGLYLSLGEVQAGDAVFDPGERRRFVPAVQAAYELGLTRHTSAVLQGFVSTGAFRHSDTKGFVENRYEATAALQSRRGRLVWSAAVTENVIYQENTPDIMFRLGATWLFGH